MNLEKGKIYVLMGPNGSGKSTLANTIMGNPKYSIKSGKILLNNDDITNNSPNEKAKKGLFLSFQYPQEISGVTISNFLKQSYNSLKKKTLSFLEFKKLLKEKANLLKINETFLERYLNEGFSGGEKKKTEIFQMLVLNPAIAILDESDSGLDIDSLKIVAEGINKFMNHEKTILIITHHKKIFDYVNPDKVFIMKNGEIIIQKGREIIEELEKRGYENIKND